MTSLNSSATVQYMSVLERALSASVVCLLCLVFLWVNLMMLYTLRSRAVFREASRHVLLFHLLFADTLQMVLTQVLFVLANVRVLLFFPLCALLVLMTHASHDFSPLMLVLMSLERFVAVCLPLRHAAIATPRNSVGACLATWAFTFIMILVRLGYMLPPSAVSALNSQMTRTCSSLVLYPTAQSRLFDEALLYSLFLAAFLSIAGSYAAVIRAACSLSTDQASARKARTTLLLHLFQLSLMVASTFHDSLMMALYRTLPWLVFVNMQTVLYIFLIILPKCLSVLVYGLRDPAIRVDQWIIQSRSVLERALAGFVVCLLCLVFLWVNLMMLYTLRSRAVFREASRHVLLFHLLFADTLQMILMQVLFVLAYVQLLLSLPLCALLVLMTHASHDFSPLMLVLMSLERFVAVCLPLRHAAIATPRNSVGACLAAWAFTFIMILVRLGYMLPPSVLSALRPQMLQTCSSLVLYPTAQSRLFDEALLYSLFLAAFLSIAGSYGAVMRAARSLSTDQASARKARTTLLLHLFQLSLMVASTVHDSLMMALYRTLPRLVFARIQSVLYIFLIILPKCLSVLVYGLRDQAIRGTLILHLCCHIGLK
ncbi:uncharacterized protein LOC110175002 [Boleophthalmus pectinirostris]|uniref:uncharacterized protein LOC110175002 n=1 Tax=Boleophthalmus pectinirostris TaxID=150288 RepID=UPI0024323B46|nr:uncharacterized protein LOC110175002 [Boleophthalmus pectinirostris]